MLRENVLVMPVGWQETGYIDEFFHLLRNSFSYSCDHHAAHAMAHPYHFGVGRFDGCDHFIAIGSMFVMTIILM